MMKRLAVIIGLLAGCLAHAQTGAINGYANLGGTSALLSGMSSTNKMQGIIPGATITVYLTGTSTKATIYKDASSTPLENPFTANAATSPNPGAWVFWAATNAGVDVIGSGGAAPNNYPAPVPLCVDCFPNSSFTPVIGSFKTNGSNNASQALLNFVDTPSVKFTNPSGGIESATVSFNVANGLIPALTPPAAGQYVIIYPTAYAITNAGSMSSVAGDTAAVLTSSSYCAFGGYTQVVWSAPVLPSYVLAANVTAVYAFAVSENGSSPVPAGNCTGNPYSANVAFMSLNASGTGSGGVNLSPGTPGGTWTLQQTTGIMTGMTGANIGTITTTAHAIVSGDFMGGTYTNIPLVGYYVYYTGTAPPVDLAVQVLPPLDFNAATNTLSISPQAQFPGTALIATTINALPIPAAANGWTIPVTNGASATDCTTGGGTSYVLCKSNGTAWSALSFTGAVSSVANSDGTLTISPTTGAVAASLALGHANTWTATQTLSGLTLSGVSGTQCLHSVSGVVSGTGSDCGSGGGGFPITLGSTSIAASSTTTAVTGLSVNGVTLSAAGAATLYLDKTGNYSTPAGGGGSPGGSSGQPQYNNAGAFGGMAGWSYPGTAGRLNGTASDTYTGSTTYGYSTLLLNGLNPSTEYAVNQPGNSVSGMIAGIAIPSTATNHQAQGFAAYMTNSSTTTMGVGAYLQGHCLLAGTACWGANSIVSDASGIGGGAQVYLRSLEADVNINSAGTDAYGVDVNGIFNAVPGSSTYAVRVALGSVAPYNWNGAFWSEDGSAVLGLSLGSTQPYTGTGPSQKLQFRASYFLTDILSDIYEDVNGYLQVEPNSNLTTFKGTISATGITSSTSPICPNGTGGSFTTSGCVTGAGAALLAASNTFTGANTNDFSGTSQLKLPTAAGYVSLANGEIGYDSTNKNFHAWVNGADTLMVPLASGFVSGHCGQPTSSGGSWTIVDVGGACGVSGGGAAFSALTSGSNTTAAMLVGTGASLGPTGTGTIAATSIDGVTVTGTPTSGQVPTATSGSAATWQTPSGGGGDFQNLGSSVTFAATGGAGTLSGGRYTITTAASAIVISSIPATFNHLKIQFRGQTSNASSEDACLQLNSDTGSNYDWVYLNGTGSSASSGSTNTDTQLHFGGLPTSATSHTLNAEVIIQNYAVTTFYRGVVSTTVVYGSSSESTAILSGEWLNTANAITSLTIKTAGGHNFPIGTAVSIDGFN